MQNKLNLKKIKEKLEKEKFSVEEELKKFAKKDDKLAGDWDTQFPKFNGGSGSAGLEAAASEVEEYATLLPIEHSLELRLRDINSALKKIDNNKYGICDNCQKDIEAKRLESLPETSFCSKCKK